jgi:hypothetical protein
LYAAVGDWSLVTETTAASSGDVLRLTKVWSALTCAGAKHTYIIRGRGKEDPHKKKKDGRKEGGREGGGSRQKERAITKP